MYTLTDVFALLALLRRCRVVAAFAIKSEVAAGEHHYILSNQINPFLHSFDPNSSAMST